MVHQTEKFLHGQNEHRIEGPLKSLDTIVLLWSKEFQMDDQLVPPYASLGQPPGQLNVVGFAVLEPSPRGCAMSQCSPKNNKRSDV